MGIRAGTRFLSHVHHEYVMSGQAYSDKDSGWKQKLWWIFPAKCFPWCSDQKFLNSKVYVLNTTCIARSEILQKCPQTWLNISKRSSMLALYSVIESNITIPMFMSQISHTALNFFSDKSITAFHKC